MNGVGIFNHNHTIIEEAKIYNEFHSENILSILSSYQFTESIFSPTIYGSMIINDNRNILNSKFFNTSGENFVNIRVKNIENQIFEYTFILADVDFEIKGDIADSAIVRLSLISRDFFKNSYTFKSRGYIKLTISEIVSKILKEELNTDIEIENIGDPKFYSKEGESTVTFAFTKIRPFEKINILKQQAFGESDDISSTFLFYETRKGYNFRSFEDIITHSQFVENIQNYVYSESLSRNQFQDITFRGIKSFEPTTRNNNLNKVVNGMFSSEVYRFDFNTKRVTVKEYDLNEDFTKFKKVNDSYNVPSVTSKFINDVRDNGKFTYFIPWDSSDGRNDMTFKHFQYSKPFMNMLKENELNIFADGNLTINLGDPINVKIWKNQDRHLKIENYEDERYSGKYIIQSLNNIIYRGNMPGIWHHDTSISLIRDTTPTTDSTPNPVRNLNNNLIYKNQG